ncbi:hypothetical protein SteCoe_16765 [Stentor coeruleus]|uniref:FZ domain-containing protein n=1 Tax=Stentor coeruleus TaxID=5963 RepID=A0A1R2C0J7_9CILI|nr:hypothetical protein SteCoe_16765 [Stentor coeruleus]
MLFLLLIVTSSACEVYEPNNPNYYCDDIVRWPVAVDVQENAWALNKKAYSLYYDLKTRYLESNDTNAPSLSCLAVAREFFCAYSFPFCLDDVNEPKRGVCSFFCDIWATRCPNEEYDLYCKNKASTDCSFSVALMTSVIVYLLF